ncbi:hypothetical protein [Limoniibacter endophyticus]|uniref:Uncharacterized protein n=1 Tax=Limoniibacter endophyticus TaxID=1565040 RepID=A0A8J3GGB9_9HYPH|nr:hypothetical protein [Limoniibacter endophyticus]GHC67762.1 hypothetical protein GCM10010136_12120 [Limoniibacter endophyticus]
MKTTLLSLFLLSGIAAWGTAIYTAHAGSDHAVVVDGYGVSAAH